MNNFPVPPLKEAASACSKKPHFVGREGMEMPWHPSFMSPVDLLGCTAELNLTLAELLSAVPPAFRNVFHMSPRLHCRKKKITLIMYKKIWTTLILEINISHFDLSAKCASHQVLNQQTIHWAKEKKMNTIRSFFVLFNCHFIHFLPCECCCDNIWCIQSSTGCCVFHFFWKLLPLGKKAKQNNCHRSNCEESNFITRSLEFTSSNLMF